MTDTRIITDDERINADDEALGALITLSEVAASSADELSAVSDELVEMQQRRRRGWSWQRIISSSDNPSALSTVTRTVANVGHASAEFRRALARALRGEGMKVTSIANLLEVSRQRVSTLVRARRSEATATE